MFLEVLSLASGHKISCERLFRLGVDYILSISHKLKSFRENFLLTIGNEFSVLDGLHNIGNGITHLLFSKRGSHFKACIILIKMTTIGPSRKSVALESLIKPRPRLGLKEDQRNTDSGCKTV